MKYLPCMLYVSLLMLASCTTQSSENEQNEVEADPKVMMLEDLEQKLERIEELEKKVVLDREMKDYASRSKLIVAYSVFVNNHRQDPRVPEYLFRAGKLANEIGKPRKAIEYLSEVHDSYPNFDKRAESAFLVGFIYEHMLNDREMAQKAYEAVIDNYPDSQWSADAKASIDLLYLTDEQKIAKFKEQQEAQ